MVCVFKMVLCSMLCVLRFIKHNAGLQAISKFIIRNLVLLKGKANYSAEMGSDAKIHIPSFIKIGSGIQNS
jgi:hypothetical protein